MAIAILIMVLLLIVLFVAMYISVNTVKRRPKVTFEHQYIIDSVKERIAKANGAAIDHYSLENLSSGQNQAVDIYKDADFVNKNCTNLDDFIINDHINDFDLQKLADLNGIQLQISKAWYPITIALIKELNDTGWNKKVSCIKEKYAGLRFYTDTDQDDILEKYQKMAEQTCETCGKKGEIRYNTGWDYVACRKHYMQNRGKIAVNNNGFNYGTTFYHWEDIKNMRFQDQYHNKRYRFLVAECSGNYIHHAGWTDNFLYISKNAIGFGNFISHIPDHFTGLDYSYIQNFREVSFCEICGYQAVYFGNCECCENDTWEEYIRIWKTSHSTKHDHLASNQMSWTLDDGELYESQHKNYAKNPDYKILFNDDDLKEYQDGEE